MQWRRRDFFRGSARQLKGYHAPPQGVGERSPRLITKFWIFKRFKVLENESIFQKYRKIEHILQKFLNFPKKNLKLKSREISHEIYQKRKNGLDRRPVNAMKTLEKFGENRLEFVVKFKTINIWLIIYIMQRKFRNLPERFPAFATKMKKLFKKGFNYILRFLIKISLENWLVHNLVLNIS